MTKLFATISSAELFYALCQSQQPADIQQSMALEATVETWMAVLQQFPQLELDVAQNRTIPNEIMQTLAKSHNENVRAVLAEKRRLPPDLFAVLANDASEVVRRNIAANQKTPHHVLTMQANDANESVAKVALYQLNLRSK